MSALFYDSENKCWASVREHKGAGCYVVTPDDAAMKAALAGVMSISMMAGAIDRYPRFIQARESAFLVRMSVVFPQQDLQKQMQAEEEPINLSLYWDRSNLILFAPEHLWEDVFHKRLEVSQAVREEFPLLRILLAAIYSHKIASQNIVAELRDLRNRLRTSLNNHEMRRIIALNRKLGDLVYSVRDFGLTLRALRAEIEAGDYNHHQIDIIFDEQKRIEEVVSLIWDRYIGVTNAYTGIIQNNAHTIMKIMTAYLAFLMLPIALIIPFHMNTPMPMKHFRYAFYALLVYSFGVSSWFFFHWGRKRGFFHR